MRKARRIRELRIAEENFLFRQGEKHFIRDLFSYIASLLSEMLFFTNIDKEFRRYKDLHVHNLHP